MPIVADPSLVSPPPPALPSANHQYALGQFLTPPPLAALLASFATFPQPTVHRLEAGAGSGALIAAAVDSALRQNPALREFTVNAGKIDPAIPTPS